MWVINLFFSQNNSNEIEVVVISNEQESEPGQNDSNIVQKDTSTGEQITFANALAILQENMFQELDRHLNDNTMIRDQNTNHEKSGKKLYCKYHKHNFSHTSNDCNHLHKMNQKPRLIQQQAVGNLNTINVTNHETKLFEKVDNFTSNQGKIQNPYAGPSNSFAQMHVPPPIMHHQPQIPLYQNQPFCFRRN